MFGNAFMKCVAAGFASVLFNTHVASFVICSGPSMESTLQTGNILLVDRISPKRDLIKKGDIVVARCPENLSIRVCKRVAAGAGDYVSYFGKIYKVPENYFWLLGDNKHDSNDSRYYGPVRKDLITGRCFCRVWPNIDTSLEKIPPVVKQENEKDSIIILL